MLLLAKIVYNTLLLLVLSGLLSVTYSVVAGNPVKDTRLFVLVLVLGSLGFSIAFTFIASIAAKANNSATLMAILSFPVILPILLTLMRLSRSPCASCRIPPINATLSTCWPSTPY